MTNTKLGRAGRTRIIRGRLATSADGIRLHAWWCPAKGSDTGASLIAMAMPATSSHRGGSILKLRKHLGVSVLIIDYPAMAKAKAARPSKGCYQAADGIRFASDEKKIGCEQGQSSTAARSAAAIGPIWRAQGHRALVLIKTFHVHAGCRVGFVLVAAGAEAHC